ncbi:MAG: VWA domain-containing protein [Deltaproteobacteria bacterium]|nr:VWA domain-containing protein [Deltaproteobacteria bacterium]
MNEGKKTGPPNGPDQVFKVDRWTSYQWSRTLDSDQRVKNIVERGREKLYSFPRFSHELFGRFFADELENVEHVKAEDRWALDAHRELGELPEFERLRRRCRGDRVNAGAASAAFAETIIDKLPWPSNVEDPEPLRDQVRGLMKFARSLKDGGSDSSEVDGLIAGLRGRGQEAVRKAVAFAEGLDPSVLRTALREACEASSAALNEVEAQLGAFCGWGNGNGLEKDVAIDVKAELARQVSGSEKLQALAREAGRLRRIAAAKQRSKSELARDEVVDVGLGADLGRLLPSELVKLGDASLSLDFARRFFERGLLQYELGGKEPQGRGPIVVCLDQSSSMEGAKEIWSKALALALLQVATMQKRHCRVVHFNAGVVRVDDWAPGRVAPIELLRSMEPFVGGGTRFEPPLQSALEAIQSNVKLRRADVVLVTDGEASLSAEFTNDWSIKKKALGFTTYAIHVDACGGIAPQQFQAVADNVIALADISNDEAVTSNLFGM